jgi:hypothetical protein
MSTDHTSRIATGTTEWAAGLLVDGLEPSTEHAITIDAGRPIARIHFAFEPRMPEEMRTNLVEGVGEAMNRELQPEPTAIPSEVAAHVLFSEGHGGYPAGSFTTQLLKTWGYADDENAARLAAGWPEYAAAFDLMRRPGGIARLTAIANGTN